MKSIPIVGIGASAGGLKEFEQFFRHMPSSKEIAFIVVQHLSPDHESVLAHIVSRYTEMEVSQITDQLEVKGGHVYINPPNHLLSIKNDRLILTEMPKDKNRHLPIDFFFRSLKDRLKEKAVGVILSGNGSDGTLGIQEIKEAGGLTIVQDPKTAEYSGMPNSAINTGLIDFVISVEEMPETILNYVSNEFKEHPTKIGNHQNENNLIIQVFETILAQTGHDFTQYKSNTIYRRIERRMTVNKLNSMSDYVRLLKTNSFEVATLYKELLISVTSFFRDKASFKYIEREIIPAIVDEAKRTEKDIRIWVPGCATGEEAYSWAILFKNYIDLHKIDIKLIVFASDVDSSAIEKARQGFYLSNITADLPQKLLDHYFISENSGYKINKEIRETVIFAKQNLTQDPPYSQLDVISCRNLLIYLDTELQQKVIATFHFALKPNGVLFLGSAESLGSLKSHYSDISKSDKLFRKINTSLVTNKLWKISFEKQTSNHVLPVIDSESVPELTKAFILERHTPPSIVINYEGEIIYAEGKTGKFIEITTGKISTSIIKLAKDELKLPLLNAIRKAKTTKKEALHKNLNVNTGDKYESIDLLVSPLKKTREDYPLLIVIFQSAKPTNSLKSETKESDEHLSIIKELEKELAEKDDSLKHTIEQIEKTNEDLKSSNEEVQSANEELQSTIEELETSKEELQSMNEELNTSNTELSISLKEVNDANSKLQNLFAATEIATIFLDKDLRITSFTPAISLIIDLLQSDIGRSIGQFTNNLAYSLLLEDAQTVLKTLIPKETEVGTADQRSFWMRIIPYRTVHDRIEGVVITFTDITQKKEYERELHQYRNFLEKLVETQNKELKESEYLLNEVGKLAKIGGWKYDIASNKVTVTKEVRKIYDISDDFDFESEDSINFYEGESKEKIAKAFETALTLGTPYDLELNLITKNGDKKIVRTIGKTILDHNGKPSGLIGTFQDITEQKEQELSREREELLRNIFDHSMLGIHIFELRGDDLYLAGANPAADEILGIDNSQHIGKRLQEIFPTMENEEIPTKLKDIAQKGGSWNNKQVIYQDDTVSSAFENFNFQISPNRMVSMFYEIGGRLKAEHQLLQSEKRLKESNDAKDKLFNIIAHDLLSPINSLLGLLELLQSSLSHLDLQEELELLHRINRKTKGTYDLIENLLHWARSQSERVSLQIKRNAIKTLLEKNMAIAEEMAKDKEIELSLEIDHDLSAYFDQNTIDTVIRNLLNNALKFTPFGGLIQVKAAKSTRHEMVEISVQDNGVGIPAEKINQLFSFEDHFSTPGTNQEKGTGLGLALCKEFIQLNKGAITVMSEVGNGTTFVVALPTEAHADLAD